MIFSSSESKDVRVVDYLFDLLDYEVWREKLEGWKLLAQSLLICSMCVADILSFIESR